MSKKLTHWFIIGTFVILYFLVSLISTIHVIDFFEMSNPKWLAISLAVAFEVGAAASLASIITLEKMNKGIVWALFILLTAMQAMGNTYYTYVHLENFQGWIELFGLIDEELIYQKRVLSIVSGAILPLVALGFIKSLVDYIKPTDEIIEEPKSIETSEQTVSLITEDIKASELLDEYADTHSVETEHTTSEENTTETKVDNIVTVPLHDADLARGKGRISFKGTV